MSYIDAFRRGDTICVSHRDKNGERHETRYPAPYYFYVEDESGPYRSMFGDRVQRIDSKTIRDHREKVESAREMGLVTYESDVRAEYRFLEDKFKKSEVPDLRIAVLDIESDRDKKKGYSRPDSPYSIINAITISRKWIGDAITIGVCPPTLSMEEAEKLVADIPDTLVVETERELLELTIEILSDADVITGWNSEWYDIPMIIQRIRITLGGEDLEDVSDLSIYDPSDVSKAWLSRLCLFGEYPKPVEKEHYGSIEYIFPLKGKVHLDYLGLYKKFTFEELHSYRLGFVLERELGETKVEYEGSLSDLWNNDFRLFIEYNRQDTVGLSKLDDVLKFITLANEMAHMACVRLNDTLGSVTIIEQAVLCELHEWNRVAPDKKENEKGEKVAGAYVKVPEGGMYEWVTSFDINSLYPSIIRMLNISPECLVGQFDISETMDKIAWYVNTGQEKDTTAAWHHFTGVTEYHDIQEGKSDVERTFNYENGESITQTCDKWKEWLEENDCCITANGTVFSTERQGILAYCLEKWYNERVEFKKKSKECDRAGDKQGAEYWDNIQMVRKIFLNSAYGALLNRYFRFFDIRFGQSTTLSGRVVTKHMINESNFIISGDYYSGPSIIYGDTDSVYTTLADHVTSNMKLDDIVELADEIGEAINDSFPHKMKEMFFVPPHLGKIIKAGREVVARRGIFKHHKKKGYALYVVDEEGKRCDKLKIMGMETQRSDTPKWIQDFLHECVRMVLMDNKGEKEVRDYVSEFREKFYNRDPWTCGSPCRISNLKKMINELELYERGLLPAPPRIFWAVQAAMNFNNYLEYHMDYEMPPIMDGDKAETFYIDINNNTRNPMGFKTVAISVDATFHSDWVKDLPVDMDRAYNKLVRQKVQNVLGMFPEWDLEPSKNTAEEVFDW